MPIGVKPPGIERNDPMINGVCWLPIVCAG